MTYLLCRNKNRAVSCPYGKMYCRYVNLCDMGDDGGVDGWGGCFYDVMMLCARGGSVM